MVTAMSMHATVKGMTEVFCNVVIVLLCGWGCRGMLSTPMQGDCGGGYEGGGRVREGALKMAPGELLGQGPRLRESDTLEDPPAHRLQLREQGRRPPPGLHRSPID
jgi:hypothetical protein